MFEIDLPAFRAAEPWMLPLSHRVTMMRAEPVKVAYYYHRPDNSTFRYRCHNMALAINEHIPGVSASWFWETDGPRVLDIVKEADILVVCRAMYKDFAAQVLDAARRFGTRIIYDIDDFIFDPQTVPLIVQTLDQHQTEHSEAEKMWTTWFALVARTRTMLMMADEMIVTNDYLAARAREHFPGPVHVIPNFMGADQLEASRRVIEARDSSAPRADGKLTLGYFSGTPTHNRDFALVSGVLARLLKRRDDISVRLVGYMDLRATPLRDAAARVEVVPHVNHLQLQRVIGETEVNLAPLLDNRFTNCKSELKYFDAGAVAIPTLTSPTFTMSAAIDHGVNGWLVRVEEWEEYIERIIDEYETTGRAMGEAARSHAVRTYCATTQAPAVAHALGLASPTP